MDPVEGTVRGRRIDEDFQIGALRDTLSHLFANPPPGINLPQQIHHLVVYGDDAKNDALQKLLAESLNADLVREAHVSSSIFDGVTVMAHTTHEHMDTVDFEMNVKSAFGCQWRSNLYGEETSEL